jgi:hypothetical protein
LRPVLRLVGVVAAGSLLAQGLPVGPPAVRAALGTAAAAAVPAAAGEPVPSVPVPVWTAPADPAEVPDPRWVDRPVPVLPPSGRVSVPVGRVPARAGGLPVSVRWADGDSSPASPDAAAGRPSRVAVRGLGQDEVARVGGRFIAFELSRDDGGAEPARVGVEVDYSGVRTAFGGNFAHRLGLVAVPACALVTPELPECDRVTRLAARNDVAAGRLYVELPVAGDPAAAPEAGVRGSMMPRGALRAAEPTGDGGVVFALDASASSSAGTFTATPLQASSKWQVGLNTGNFGYSYPFGLPPAVAGPVPSLGLSYSSQAVDGRTGAESSQPSWVGEGWNFEPGFIERKVGSCASEQYPTESSNWGDLCWSTPTYLINFGGQSSELVLGTDGFYHLRDDPGWKAERLLGWTGNGDDTGEYWQVTTPDGTRHLFGYGKEPNNDDRPTNSAWTVPVIGDDPGEPCYSAPGRECQQAWRWNLDRVVDSKGNVASLFWAKEKNYYGQRGSKWDVEQYDRGGYLTRVEYSKRYGYENYLAHNVVTVSVANRCVDPADCPAPDSAVAGSTYPDVPLDLLCSGSPCSGTGQLTPTFFTTKRLASLTTYVRADTTPPSYANVARYDFTHTFPETKDAYDPSLWLDVIERTGLIGSDSDSITVPPVELHGVAKDNGADANEINKYRLDGIRDELGGYTEVTYGQPDPCPSPPPVSGWDANTKNCFPVSWDPPYGDSGFSAFN